MEASLLPPTTEDDGAEDVMAELLCLICLELIDLMIWSGIWIFSAKCLVLIAEFLGLQDFFWGIFNGPLPPVVNCLLSAVVYQSLKSSLCLIKALTEALILRLMEPQI